MQEPWPNETQSAAMPLGIRRAVQRMETSWSYFADRVLVVVVVVVGGRWWCYGLAPAGLGVKTGGGEGGWSGWGKDSLSLLMVLGARHTGPRGVAVRH